MKKDIHPKWYPEAKVKCTCGNTFTTGATVPEIEVDVCSACHSFFTGNQKLVDSTGRVTRYKERLAKSQSITNGLEVKKKDKKKPGNKIKKNTKQSV